MFGIGWIELAIVAGVAVVVIGPQDMPHVLYKIGKIVRKIKLFMSDVQSSIDDVTRDVELDEITREVNEEIGGVNLQFEIERQIIAEDKARALQDKEPLQKKAVND